MFLGLDPVLRLAHKDSPVLVQSKDDRLFVASYSTFHTVIHEVPWDGGKDIRAVLTYESAKQMLSNFVGEAEFVDDSVRVSAGKDSATFTTLRDADISLSKLAHHFTQEDALKIYPSEFTRLFAETKHSSNSPSVGDVRFMGYHLAAKENSLEAMASDGSILSLSTTATPIPETRQGDTIILNQEFGEVAGLFLAYEDVSLAWNNNAMSVVGTLPDGMGTTRVVSSLIRGEPVLYQAVIDRVSDSNKEEYRLQKEDVLEALNKIVFFTGDDNKHRVSFHIEGDICTASATSLRGEGQASFPITKVSSTVNEWSMDVSMKYLMLFLKSTKHAELTLLLGGEKTPLLFLYGTSTEVITVFSS